MAALPEDKKLAEVEQQLEEEVEKLEQKVDRNGSIKWYIDVAICKPHENSAENLTSVSSGLHERSLLSASRFRSMLAYVPSS